jgi:predicted DNA-binding transcriptional regulator AlpA
MKTAEKYKEYKGPEDLPGMLRVKDCAEYTGTNSQKWYEIFKRQDFHSIKLGGRYVVAKEEFLRWLKAQSQK